MRAVGAESIQPERGDNVVLRPAAGTSSMSDSA